MHSEPTRLAKGLKACLLVCIPSISESIHWKEHGPTTAFNVWAKEVQFERRMGDYAKRNKLNYKHLYNSLRPKLINCAKNKRQHWKSSAIQGGGVGEVGQGEEVDEGDECEDGEDVGNMREGEDVEDNREDVEDVRLVEKENQDEQRDDFTELGEDGRDIVMTEHGAKIFPLSNHYPRTLRLRVNPTNAVSPTRQSKVPLTTRQSRTSLAPRVVLSGVKLTKKRHQHISPPANPEPPAGTSSGKTAGIEEAKKAKLEAEKLELAEFLEWL